MKICKVLELTFWPSRFTESEIENIRQRKERGEQVVDPDKFRPDAIKRIKKKNKGIWSSFFTVAILIASGIVSAKLLNPHIAVSILTLKILRTCSLGIVAWAVLSRIGHDTETIGNVTLLQEISKDTFRLFYYIGIYGTVLTLFLDS